MFFVIILSWIATACIVLTYLLINVYPKWRFAFNLANAIGAVPLSIVEITARAWSPIYITTFFGLIGLFGVIRKTYGR